jgi:hypothetical protein
VKERRKLQMLVKDLIAKLDELKGYRIVRIPVDSTDSHDMLYAVKTKEYQDLLDSTIVLVDKNNPKATLEKTSVNELQTYLATEPWPNDRNCNECTALKVNLAGSITIEHTAKIICMHCNLTK